MSTLVMKGVFLRGLRAKIQFTEGTHKRCQSLSPYDPEMGVEVFGIVTRAPRTRLYTGRSEVEIGKN
jgi:hypothetical protein